MKRTITLCTLIVFASLASSTVASASSKLHLDLFNDGQFVVHIDGMRYDQVRNGLDVSGLFPGTHHIKIVEVFRGRGHHHRDRSVLYNGSINIPFRSAVFARLTPNLQLRITEIQPLTYNRRTPSPRYRGSDHHRRGSGYSGNGNRNYNRGSSRRYREHQPMFDAFSFAKSEMQSATWDKDKLQIAKSFVKGGVTASELSSMMSLLTFEKSKVELAKFGYSELLDPQNINLVHDAFTYDSSVRELNKFIRNRRK